MKQQFHQSGVSMVLKLSLTSVPGFQYVSEEDAVRLSSIAKVVVRNKGDSVLLSGERVSAIYIVAEGAVGVYQSGVAKPIAELGAGQCFGEMSFIDSSRASATIRAMTTGTTLIMLRQDELQSVSKDNPELRSALYQGIALTLAQKLRNTTAKITERLAVGRNLLEQLGSAETLEKVDIQSLPKEIIRQNTVVMDGMNEVVRALEAIGKKIPERSASLKEVTLDLIETKDQCEKFFLNMSRHVAAISVFLTGMEEFINNQGV